METMENAFCNRDYRLQIYSPAKSTFAPSMAVTGKPCKIGRSGRIQALVYSQAQFPQADQMKTIVYPGTFNPITKGHTDLVERASKIFDRVIVAVGTSSQKNSSLSLQTRVDMASRVLSHLDNVSVKGFTCLLTDFVKAEGAHLILRGLRTVADFEYEFQMVGMNRAIAPEIETVFLAPAEQYAYISSTLVREIAVYGGDISHFVDPIVLEMMPQSYGKN